MKSKTLLFVFIFLGFAFSFETFSQSTVCANPLKAICGGQDAMYARLTKESKVYSMKQQIVSEARTNAKPIIEKMIKKYPDRRDHNKVESQKKLIFYQEIMNSASARMSGIEVVVTNAPIVTSLKSLVKIAVRESTLDDLTKVRFQAIIDSVIIGNFTDFIKSKNFGKEGLAKFENRCGINGMVQNAFATTLAGQRYVLICPGFQITMYQMPDMRDRINNILVVLSHEIGHHIDSGATDINLYVPFLECMLNNYANNLAKSQSKGNDVRTYCLTNDLNKCNSQRVLSHARELIADLWANKVLAIYARGADLSIGQTDLLLRSSWMSLCDSEDEGIHPSGNFRIGIMLRLAPEISDVLSCDNSGLRKNSCTLAGEVKLR